MKVYIVSNLLLIKSLKSCYENRDNLEILEDLGEKQSHSAFECMEKASSEVRCIKYISLLLHRKYSMLVTSAFPKEYSTSTKGYPLVLVNVSHLW